MYKILFDIIYKLYNKTNKHLSGRKLKFNLKFYLSEIFTILKLGIPWRTLKSDAHYTTIYKFYKKLVKQNIFKTAFDISVKIYYKTNEKINEIKNLFIDSTMIKNINGCELLGRNHYDRNRLGNKITVLVDEKGIPVSIFISKANVYDSKITEQAINNASIKIIHKRIIGDKGYISNKTKNKLKNKRISLIYPYRKNQQLKNSTFQKNLLKKRHIVENFFSWLKRYRRFLSKNI